MSHQAARGDAGAPGGRGFMILVYCVQFFFGGWFLYNGLNYFIRFFPQPTGSSPLSHELIAALTDTGLFAVVKGVEVVVGLALLANRFVPLAVVAAFPISICIAHINLVANGDAFSVTTCVIIILLNSLMAVGHLDRFLPMLAFDSGDPSARGLARLFGRVRP